MRQTAKLLIISVLGLILVATVQVRTVHSQSGTASELIGTVNSLRQSQGLAPYTVDSFLMNFAQSHSDYMASIGTWTHVRADGTTAFDYGIKENVAMGTDMTVQHCVYTIWSDWVHWQTMMGYEAGSVGAGVAVSNGNVYYTLNVLPAGNTYQEPNNTNTENVAMVQPQNTQDPSIYYSFIVTSTPSEDGIIIHTVQYGETLWTIAEAYGVPIDEILRNSGLNPTTTEVFEGDQLLIRPATDTTPTARNTTTPEPNTPTPTITQPRSSPTPLPTRTPMPTFTPTDPPSFVARTLGETSHVGLGLILVSGLGLLLVIYLGFIKKS